MFLPTVPLPRDLTSRLSAASLGGLCLVAVHHSALVSQSATGTCTTFYLSFPVCHPQAGSEFFGGLFQEECRLGRMPAGKPRSTERFFQSLVSLSKLRIMAIPNRTVMKIKTRCEEMCAWHREAASRMLPICSLSHQTGM